jgi:hypothetical protein
MAKILKNGQTVEVLATSKGLTEKGETFDIADPSKVTITARSPRLVRKQNALWAKFENLDGSVTRAYVLLDSCLVGLPENVDYVTGLPV